MKLKANLKDKANQSMDSPAQIVQRCIQMVPSNSAPHMPNKDAMRKLIQRERNKNLPPIPKDIHSVVIPEKLMSNDCGEKFQIGHYIDDNECVLVFSTKENLRLLNEAKFWMMDGTFACCQRPFRQIYTVHAMVGAPHSTHKIVPLVYGLLSHKSVKSYKIFLEIIKCVDLIN